MEEGGGGLVGATLDLGSKIAVLLCPDYFDFEKSLRKPSAIIKKEYFMMGKIEKYIFYHDINLSFFFNFLEYLLYYQLKPVKVMKNCLCL